MKINIIIKESWGFIHTNIFQGTLNWDAQTEHAVAKSKIIVVGFQISKEASDRKTVPVISFSKLPWLCFLCMKCLVSILKESS
jgi:hypothetical protein